MCTLKWGICHKLQLVPLQFGKSAWLVHWHPGHPNLNLHLATTYLGWGESASQDDKPTNHPLPKTEGTSLWFGEPNQKNSVKIVFFTCRSFLPRFSGYQIGLDDDLQHVARTFPSIHWYCLQLHLSWLLGWWRSDWTHRSVEKMSFYFTSEIY